MIANSSVSIDHTSDAFIFSVAIDNIPEPHPKSRTVFLSKFISSIFSNIIFVVGWWPVPNPRPGFKFIIIRESLFSNLVISEVIRKFFPILIDGNF